MSRLLVHFAVVVALFTLSANSSGKNLTPYGEQHPVLTLVQSALDKDNIDVRSTYWRMALGSARPVLAPLGELPVVPPSEPWPEVEKDFNAGAFGFLTATAGAGGARLGTSATVATQDQKTEMLGAWAKTEPRQRVFLSFTKPDRDSAMKVRKALEQQGYAVFTYLKEQGPPLFTVEEVGKFFREAGQRLVLDTKNSRKSTGVWIERAAEEQFKKEKSLKSEIARLRNDEDRFRRWYAQRTPPSLGIGAPAPSPEAEARRERVRQASMPFAESLFYRAEALHHLLEAFVDEKNPDRDYLARSASSWLRRLGGKIEKPRFESTELSAQAELFDRRFEELETDPALPQVTFQVKLPDMAKVTRDLDAELQEAHEKGAGSSTRPATTRTVFDVEREIKKEREDYERRKNDPAEKISREAGAAEKNPPPRPKPSNVERRPPAR